jgi:acyl-CoA synthetase (AMP-forming)/AMP-acid ligase II/peptidoglycan/LPS O-acetylase OafA/YrhL
LAPNTSEPDALDALNQFKADHLLLFDGVDCPGVEKAFETYAASGKAKIHKAVIVSDGRPGMFEYTEGKEIHGTPLANPVNGICLLLRTSGTTARPKGVPLQQGALVTNGAILASSMGLQESDVCYSCMPLFHIGGISASILCTLASGGSVSCDSEPFDPSRMVDALGISRPQPTWYSSVPTIHNATVAYLKDVASSDPNYTAYGINSDGIWSEGHSLRMIRSGAAALLGPDGDALAAAYGGVPIYPTYSMSEQMPISQPPAGKTDTFTAKRGSVGVPVAASTAIVSRSKLRLQPRGVEGEIAISGPTVLKNYLDNPAADSKSYFYLTLPSDGNTDENDLVENDRYFLTGDIGTIDDEGFLTLKGRAKELIKKGGEQVSPFEVEEPLLTHPWVQTPVCFAVPSKLYGEEVGCALVLSSKAPQNVEQREVIVAMRGWLKDAKLAPVKWPTKWVICADSDLPKTKTKKYIRIGLSTVLGLDPEEDGAITTKESKEPRAKMDWGVLGGLRFILACWVMFMHIGSKESWGPVANLRGFPWHVHVFFTLGGYSLAAPMNPVIQKKFSYFMARIGSVYPMYAVALFFALINLLVVCRPSTFSKDFHWDSQPDDLYTEDGELAPLFCEGTPVTQNSYWASLALTLVTYIFGAAVTPAWPLAWNLGYYLWFNSMYYQCLAIFPALYNALFNGARKNARLLLQVIVALMVLNVAIVLGAWYALKDEDGYNHYNPATGEKNPVEEYNDASAHNIAGLSFYLFGPFWMLYFVIGACTAFLYDAYRPAERHNAWIWGYVADSCTLIMIGLSVSYIAQGYQPTGEIPEAFYLRPDEANEFTDNLTTNRIWDNINGRLMCPLTTLWVFSLSTGHGITAAFLRREVLVETLSPNSYNCFLFHQMVAQWYYAATRHGAWWNWWNYRKTFYWFSPDACPVEWYEYFLVVGLVVGWSRIMLVLEPLVVGNGLATVKAYFTKGEAEGDEEVDTVKVLCGIIESMTGIEPLADWTLEECGLASIGVPVLVGLLNKAFSKKDKPLVVSARDLITAETIGDMAAVVDDLKKLADAQGV